MIKLGSPVVLNEHIIPVCIDERGSSDLSGMKALVSGWGPRYFGGPTYTQKQHGDTTMFSQDLCQNKYGWQYNQQYNICGGESNTNSDTCQGDSGASLVYQNPQNGLWYNIGLVSWTLDRGCRLFFFIF
jgi:secreted trypsin-like serine protease